jgi:RNA polymerase sigma factor (sigma-70 family)
MSPLNAEFPVVSVVDDDADVCRSLDRLLRASGLAVQTYETPTNFLEQFQPRPGCIVLDLKMPKLTGMELQAELARRNIRTPVVFLTGHGDVPTSVRAMKDGAVDFLTKPFRARDLLQAIHAAIAKDRQQRQSRQEQQAIQARIANLTEREAEVFHLVVSGMLNKQIAVALGINEGTVKVHRARVMRKMEVVSVAELTRLAERGGMSVGADGNSDGPCG